jgi:hypothetical protein
MRENRPYGSEGGAARAVPTPIIANSNMDPSFRWGDGLFRASLAARARASVSVFAIQRGVRNASHPSASGLDERSVPEIESNRRCW